MTRKTFCGFDGCGRPQYKKTWCQPHYNQEYRTGVLKPIGSRTSVWTSPFCSVEGCDRPRKSKGMCAYHYQAVARGKVELRLIDTPVSSCDFPLCARPRHAHGLCSSHDYQRKQGQELRPIGQKRPAKWTVNTDGYVQKSTPSGTVLQHREVMAEAIGRPLTEEENVHHRNGVRHDNRLENLELWSTSQPSGQRVEDKVEWAKEILSLYAPHELSMGVSEYR